LTIAFGFLNPLLLWALPLAAVPVIIHLLNRRRFQRVRWAAMEYLLNALKRNRRRLRMEHWLLLALRTLAVLLLVFLVSRPQMTGSVLGGTRTHHVVLLDDSASMAHRSGALDAFDEARDRIVQIGEKLADTRAGDLLTVLRASDPDRPDLLAVRVGAQLGGQLRDLVATRAAGDGTMDVAALLRAARERIAERQEAARAELWFVTDLRRVDWLAADGKPKPQIAAELASLDPQSHHLTLVPVGQGDTRNLAVTAVRHEGRVPVVGVPVPFAVEIRNQGASQSEPGELAFTVDGQSRVVRQIEPLAAGEATVVQLQHVFHEPGYHGVRAALPTDRFAPDDHRSLALAVGEHSRVLIVDGDPGDREEDAESYYVAAALEPGGEGKSGVRAETIPEHALADHELAGYDAIWLCNVPTPAPAVAAKLEEFAAEGGGVVIWLGNQVDPVRYDQVLFRGGEGLLPAALVGAAGDADRPEPIFLADRSHGSVQVVTELLEQLFAGVPVLRWFEVDAGAAPAVRVVLRVRDSQGPPLLLARHFGRGEVALVTTTADTAWSGWPHDYSFQIVLLELHRTLARVHTFASLDLGPADALDVDLHQGRYRLDAVVRDVPDGLFERTFTAPPSADGEVARLRIPMAEVRGLGLFELHLAPHAGGTEKRMFARNVPLVEGELQRFTSAAFQAAYPIEQHDRVTFVEAETAQAALLRAGQGEIWRVLALALLGALLLESVLAWRFGRRGS
jgi:hypothetical protein